MCDLQPCTDNIKAWMCNNQLKLNEDKTESILLSTPSLSSCHCLPSSVMVGTYKIVFSDISSIHRYLTKDAAKQLVSSCVLSKLDYCNSLLMGTPSSVIQPMQKVQNTAACLIFRAPHHKNCTPLLQQLHWLPINEWIKYKTACLCYIIITGFLPSYLFELRHLYSPSHSVCSSSETCML